MRPPNKLERATGPETYRIMVTDEPPQEWRIPQGYRLRDDIRHCRTIGRPARYAVFVRPRVAE
jgi:hypothetical protein